MAHDTFRLKLPIQSLVEQMLDQLPAHVWQDPHTTFLDPAFGGGQFVLAIERRLKEAGHSLENIASRIYGCESLPTRVKYVQNWHKSCCTNLYVRDPLTHDWGKMKFDVIVGNPPYQSTEAVGKKLWPAFVELSNRLCKQGGYVCMVTPSTWLVRPQGKSMKLMTQQMFIEHHLLMVDTRTEQYFDVGETIGAWVVHKHKPENARTIIHTHTGVLDIVYEGQQVALNPRLQTTYDIMTLVENKSENTLRDHVYNDVVTSISIEEQIEKKMIHNKGTKNRVPLFWTASNTNTYYLDRNEMRPGIKVILNKSGYYYQENNADKYMLVDDKGTYAIGAGALGITCVNLRQAKNMISFLKSKLYQFYINNEKTSGFNTGIIKLPMLDVTKSWTDQEVYDWFGLTPEQQQFVDANYGLKIS